MLLYYQLQHLVMILVIALIVSFLIGKLIGKLNTIPTLLNMAFIGLGDILIRRYKTGFLSILGTFPFAFVIYFFYEIMPDSFFREMIERNTATFIFTINLLYSVGAALYLADLRMRAEHKEFLKYKQDTIDSINRDTQMLREARRKKSVLSWLKGTQKNTYTREKGIQAFHYSLDYCMKNGYSICMDTNFFMEIVRNDEKLLDKLLKMKNKSIWVSTLILNELEDLKQGDTYYKVQKATAYLTRLNEKGKIQYVGQDSTEDFNKYVLSKNLKPRVNDDVILCHYLYQLETLRKRKLSIFKKPKIMFFNEDRIALNKAASRGMDVVTLFDTNLGREA
ncbi:PIN domain-containing protein [Metabacillus litoralis]|uniref:PIN domain-containing protein n=1 Tax=Metabacillus litoralis TaxID=152268 RepID=UPI000EF57C92|nr:PIN domain-containing protein [Metabacillus litoralis]